jgi:hypothetical protein
MRRLRQDVDGRRHWDADGDRGRIADNGADYVLALKANQTSLDEDAALFFADPVLAATCAGRIRTPVTAGSKSAVAGPPRRSGSLNATPTGLRSTAAVTARRIDKKTGGASLETATPSRPPTQTRRSFSPPRALGKTPQSPHRPGLSRNSSPSPLNDLGFRPEEAIVALDEPLRSARRKADARDV